jgi:hypothetical protein
MLMQLPKPGHLLISFDSGRNLFAWSKDTRSAALIFLSNALIFLKYP